MKKVHWKSFSLGIIITIALALGIGEVSAASTSIVKNIKVSYNNIKIMVNSHEVNLGKDSSGKKIEPFTYNGTTYLPVRAVSEALGETVNWDAKENKVYIGTYPGKIDRLYDVAYPYNYSALDRDGGTFQMGGLEYNSGFKFFLSDGYMYSNLQGKYTTLKFDLGNTSVSDNTTSSLNVYLDGKLYSSFEVNSNELPKSVTIPVEGVHQIKFETGDSYTVGIGEPILYVEK